MSKCFSFTTLELKVRLFLGEEWLNVREIAFASSVCSSVAVCVAGIELACLPAPVCRSLEGYNLPPLICHQIS